MDIVCKDINEYIGRLRSDNYCFNNLFNPETGNYEDMIMDYYSYNGDHYMLPMNAVYGSSSQNINVNIEGLNNKSEDIARMIQEQIDSDHRLDALRYAAGNLDVFKKHQEEDLEEEIVSEIFLDGFKYQLIKREMTNDELNRSKKFKRKRKSQERDFGGIEQRVS